MTFLPPALSALGHRMALFVVLACFILVQAFPAGAQEYRIRAGDTLRIEVIEDPSLNRTVLVAPDGRISVPAAGTLRAAGRTVETVQSNLTQLLAGSFATTPNVFVAIEQLAERRAPPPTEEPVISVYVVGEANSPGKLDIAPGTTALQAFAMMGGFTKFAATKRIQLRRTDPISKAENVYLLNYARVEKGDVSGLQIPLAEGDVIVVPQRRLFE